MGGLAAWLIAGLGIGVIVVRRRSVAVGLVTAQALVLAAIAARQPGSGANMTEAAALAVRAVALGGLFLFAVARSREPRPVTARFTPAARAGIAAALILALTSLVPPIGLTSPPAQRTVLALVATGLTCVATRRATLFQVLGIVLTENGLALAALASPHASSLVIELGVTIDLTLIAVVAAIFHLRIFSEHGAGDSSALRSLRD